MLNISDTVLSPMSSYYETNLNSPGIFFLLLRRFYLIFLTFFVGINDFYHQASFFGIEFQFEERPVIV